MELISFSTDSMYAHLTWKNSEKMLEKVKFQMGSDSTGCISRYFGVYDDAGGNAQRATFIIDPDGVLMSSEINFQNVGRNAAELFRKMEAFIHVRNNPQEICPANWSPGKKTLNPLASIVNRIQEALDE